LRTTDIARLRSLALVLAGLFALTGGGCGSSKPGAAGAPDGGGAGGGAGDAAGDGAGGGCPTVDLSDPNATIIQEDMPGFDAVDGKVLPRQGNTGVTCYTGTGFADSDPGVGKAISWSVSAVSAGTYSFVWRYAFGGDASNIRDARLLVNGAVVADMVPFAYTNTWNDWQETAPMDVPLDAGESFIQLEALDAGGLANFDYFKIVGPGITPETPSFTITVNQNDPAGGTVSYAPVQSFYKYGATVTVTATPSPGYVFQSWTGDAPAATATAQVSIVRNTVMTARFLPAGATQDPDVVGYATVQDDAGTPYLLTGGSLGASVTATTLDDLKMYLGSSDPYVVSFSGVLTGADAISVGSDKTLLGVGDSAHLDGIELEINGSRNVIIRNMTVSNVVADGSGIANDAIEITGGAKNIWIDHCHLYSDLDHGKDYYDGLLDIKNESSFITVSWCEIDHHFKASLISSGDEQVSDTVIRATYHHNYFHDCGSRLPSIRFGKAHMFSNYYFNNTTGSCVDSRMGAVVKVDGNYFQMSKDTIGWFEGPKTGSWDVASNVFQACTGPQPTTSTGQLTPPYQYTLDTVTDLPTTIPAGAGVGKM
jgi:pectate lyase